MLLIKPEGNIWTPPPPDHHGVGSGGGGLPPGSGPGSVPHLIQQQVGSSSLSSPPPPPPPRGQTVVLVKDSSQAAASCCPSCCVGERGAAAAAPQRRHSGAELRLDGVCFLSYLRRCVWVEPGLRRRTGRDREKLFTQLEAADRGLGPRRGGPNGPQHEHAHEHAHVHAAARRPPTHLVQLVDALLHAADGGHGPQGVGVQVSEAVLPADLEERHHRPFLSTQQQLPVTPQILGTTLKRGVSLDLPATPTWIFLHFWGFISPEHLIHRRLRLRFSYDVARLFFSIFFFGAACSSAPKPPNYAAHVRVASCHDCAEIMAGIAPRGGPAGPADPITPGWFLQETHK